jgi:hypothetical protein
LRQVIDYDNRATAFAHGDAGLEASELANIIDFYLKANFVS